MRKTQHSVVGALLRSWKISHPYYSGASLCNENDRLSEEDDRSDFHLLGFIFTLLWRCMFFISTSSAFLFMSSFSRCVDFTGMLMDALMLLLLLLLPLLGCLDQAFLSPVPTFSIKLFSFTAGEQTPIERNFCFYLVN